MTHFKDKTVVITGGATGIGFALAKRFGSEGARIVIGEPRQDRLDGATEALKALGIEAASMVMDVTDEASVTALADFADATYGGTDVLINNAGIQHVAPVETFPPSKWDDILAINFSSAFHTSRTVFHDMRENGWGRIINIASVHGLIASPYKSAYVAAKHGIVGLTKVLALEGAEAGITANAICPGYVWTPLVEKQIEDQAEAHGISEDEVISSVLLKNTPTKKFAQPEEIAELCLFLCGAGGNSITGQALPVDGGWTAH